MRTKNILRLTAVVAFMYAVSCETYERRTGITTLEPVVNGTSVTLRGSIDDLSKKTHTDYGFFYSTSPEDPGTQVSLGSNPDVGDFSHSLDNAYALTTYYSRAYVKEGSEFMYGENVSFQTQGSITKPAVTTSSVTDITSSMAICGGNVTAYGGRDVTARGICWNTSPSPTVADSMVQSGSGLGSFTATMTGLSYDTTYYVRAWATNDSGTAYGEEQQFTTGTILSQPANGATGVSPTPTFQWSAVSGATSYHIQVSTVSDFSTTVIDQSGITNTSYAVSSALSNGTYYWRVRASTAGGPGNWSGTWSFTISPPGAPTLVSPANGATGVSPTPTFQWSAVSGAVSYQIQVSTSSGFGTTVINQSSITATSYTSTVSLTSGTTYYWRVRATNGSGTGNWSATWSFTVLAIGQSYQGGIIAYILQPGDPGYVAGQTHGIIAAPSDQSAGIQWYNGTYVTTGATGTALGTGNANTNLIVTVQGTGSYAAKLCYDLVLGGYSDWYLPSKDELNKLYLNRTAIGGFSGVVAYATSSEYSSTDALYQNLVSGFQSHNLKSSIAPVRAVRAF